MNESKLKHSYSLTSLSSRFLSSHNNNHSSQHHNGSHATLNNGGPHHQQPHFRPQPNLHSEEPEGSDDYGFLSGFCESRGDGNGSSGSKPVQLQLQQSGLNKSSLYSSYSTGNTMSRSNQTLVPSAASLNNTLMKKHSNHNHHPPSCGCDCHGAGTKVNKLTSLDASMMTISSGVGLNGYGPRLLGTSNTKLNASCQALNSCSSTSSNGGGGTCHNNPTNGLVNGNGSSSTNFTSLLQLNNLKVGASSSTKNNNSNNNNNSSGVRVRRTLSCYVKHPQGGTPAKSLLDTDSASTLNVATASGAEKSGLDFGYNPPPSVSTTSFNPICEFSPYSSLSSNDLLRVGTAGTGSFFPDRRFSASTVFYHDNPVDCGCPTCFQVKLSIFQVKSSLFFFLLYLSVFIIFKPGNAR